MNERLKRALVSARDTQACVIGEAVTRDLAALFCEQFPNTRAAIVADTNTFAAAGDVAYEVLRRADLTGPVPFVFDAQGLEGEMSYVERLCGELSSHNDIPVVVGSGTLNDLAKLAAHRLGRPYMVVGTAASMDGYTAYGASIIYQGNKQTFSCPAPRAVLADLAVIRKAPSFMTAAGYADLMAKVVAGADWIVADALGVEPIDAEAWEIVQGGLHDALADPFGVRDGDRCALSGLVEGLMLAGFAMQAAQTSRPASGAEHQFSHLWDMEHHTYKGAAPSHGFKVGVATHFIAKLYEQVLNTSFDSLDVATVCAQWPLWPEAEAQARRLYAGTDFPDLGVQEVKAKYVDREELAARLIKLKAGWSTLHARLSDQLLSAEEVERRLVAAGAPSEPEQIGISPTRLRNSVLRAQHIRRRFTVLDLAVQTGMLGNWLDG